MFSFENKIEIAWVNLCHLCSVFFLHVYSSYKKYQPYKCLYQVIHAPSESDWPCFNLHFHLHLSTILWIMHITWIHLTRKNLTDKKWYLPFWGEYTWTAYMLSACIPEGRLTVCSFFFMWWTIWNYHIGEEGGYNQQSLVIMMERGIGLLFFSTSCHGYRRFHDSKVEWYTLS